MLLETTEDASSLDKTRANESLKRAKNRLNNVENDLNRAQNSMQRAENRLRIINAYENKK